MTSDSEGPDSADTARAQDFLDRLELNGRIADQVRELLVQSARLVAEEFTNLATTDWPEHAQAAHAADRSSTLDERYGTVSDLIRDEARLDLHTVSDTLRGYAALIETQSSFVGAVACGRAVYESSVWAASVLDGSIGPEVRSQRALTRRLARLHATQRHVTLLDPTSEPDAAACEESDYILALARSRGWKVIDGRFAPSIGTRLSVEKLAPTLPGAVGVEGYAWGAASSLIHGEQPTLAQSWISFSFDRIPAWLTGAWTPSVPFGTRIAFATVSDYIGEEVGHEAWELLHRTWDTARSQPAGWRF
ncbi:hypothetical protein EXE59_14500 [Nocardioides eburneiflavus]|uniref:Uncharacterized protein n=1 Tax=Nocardioides eburneiflavus TaxID=2518372 RepID=A0A4Z1BUV5_9ACTN|nr:hypothetical protein [Nocardioides eburneiflavus]TGN65041.1 hypothetical protein EXE59_14500 [Nocardioides eburneiflavus]